MVGQVIRYQGQLRCVAQHGPSGETLTTDAPLDNHGKGEHFSPTDLVATALATCILTTLGIVAQREKINLEGMHAQIEKFMAPTAPRRLGRLLLDLTLPLPADHPARPKLERAAAQCPVHHSLHPDIQIDLQWHWVG